MKEECLLKCAELDIEDLKRRYVYDPETGRITFNRPATSKRHGKEVGSIFTCATGKKYRIISMSGGRKVKAHRAAWVMHHGEQIPAGMGIDHIDGNGLNNRIENLRTATPFENGGNQKMKKVNKTGVNGVVFRISRQRFVAIGRRKGYPHLCQSHETLLDAVAARKSWERGVDFHENHGQDRPL